MNEQEQLNYIFGLSRKISDLQWEGNQTVTIEHLTQLILASALQGNYLTYYKFPKGISQAFIAVSKGEPFNLPDAILKKWQTNIARIDTLFKNSPFEFSEVSFEDGGVGLKISWKDLPPAPAAAPKQPLVVDEQLDNIVVEETTETETTEVEEKIEAETD